MEPDPVRQVEMQRQRIAQTPLHRLDGAVLLATAAGVVLRVPIRPIRMATGECLHAVQRMMIPAPVEDDGC